MSGPVGYDSCLFHEIAVSVGAPALLKCWAEKMKRAEIEAALAAAVDAESAVGIRWWPGVEMAPIAFRRWSTFARRHKIKHPTIEQRVLDLVKGLQARFEPGIPRTPSSEWLHLAHKLAAVFMVQSESTA